MPGKLIAAAENVKNLDMTYAIVHIRITMHKLKPALPLTETSPEVKAWMDNTFMGQASWARGPEICCNCVFFRRRGDRGSCRMAKKLMGLARHARFPCTALSCHYFAWQRRPGPRGRHQHAKP